MEKTTGPLFRKLFMKSLPTVFSIRCIGWLLVFALAGCATTQRPVLYPNAKLKRVGNEAAQWDVDDCMRMAEQYGVSPGGGEKVARGAGEGAAVGGATGAVRSDRPSQPYRGFVQRCLRERGYDVIGWQ